MAPIVELLLIVLGMGLLFALIFGGLKVTKNLADLTQRISFQTIAGKSSIGYLRKTEIKKFPLNNDRSSGSILVFMDGFQTN